HPLAGARATPRASGGWLGACRLPEPGRGAGRLLDLHLSVKRRDGELDRDPGRLGGAARALGVLARRRRAADLGGAARPCRSGAGTREVRRFLRCFLTQSWKSFTAYSGCTSTPA